MKKALFISHDASRTGAPILLLNLARALKETRSGIKTSFLIKTGSSELIPEFKKLGPTYKAGYVANSLLKKFQNRLQRHPSPTYDKNVLKEALTGIDFVVSNTVTNGDILPLVRLFFSGPIVSYIHELHMGTKFFTTDAHLKLLLQYTNHFLVPAEAVRQFLHKELFVATKFISKLDYYIPNSSSVPKTHSKPKFCIGAAGTIDWRKGADLFILTAKRFTSKYPAIPVSFVWKGAADGISLQRLQFDIKQAGLENIVEFKHASANMELFYASLDLLLLLSREDPYPLVVLEAANAAVPTICFMNTGGASEFLQRSAGLHTVPYLDLENLVDTVHQALTDRALLEQAGLNAKKELELTHNNSQYIADQFKKVLLKIYE